MVISVPSVSFLWNTQLPIYYQKKSYDMNSCLEAKVWDPIFGSYNVKRRRRQKTLKLLTPASSAGDAIHRSKGIFSGCSNSPDSCAEQLWKCAPYSSGVSPRDVGAPLLGSHGRSHSHISAYNMWKENLSLVFIILTITYWMCTCAISSSTCFSLVFTSHQPSVVWLLLLHRCDFPDG